MSCQRTQGFLAKRSATVATTVNAKKEAIPGKDVLKVLDGIDTLAVAKGTRVVQLDLRIAKPSRDELAALLIGPSGNLRAPTLRMGRTLLVGFNEEMYRQFVG